VIPIHLEIIRGRKSKALDEMLDEPIIVEFKNRQIFGGNIDGYEQVHFGYI
jgi:small nuclear ribonucleoprotein (snRNP)-like protein